MQASNRLPGRDTLVPKKEHPSQVQKEAQSLVDTAGGLELWKGSLGHRARRTFLGLKLKEVKEGMSLAELMPGRGPPPAPTCSLISVV